MRTPNNSTDDDNKIMPKFYTSLYNTSDHTCEMCKVILAVVAVDLHCTRTQQRNSRNDVVIRHWRQHLLKFIGHFDKGISLSRLNSVAFRSQPACTYVSKCKEHIITVIVQIFAHSHTKQRRRQFCFFFLRSFFIIRSVSILDVAGISSMTTKNCVAKKKKQKIGK